MVSPSKKFNKSVSKAVQIFFAFINKMKAVLLITSITLTLIVFLILFLIFSRSSVTMKQNFEKVKMVGMSTCDKTREQLKSLDRTRVIPCMLDKEVIVNGITIPVCGDNDFLDITTFPQWMQEDNTPIGSGIKSVREIKNLNKELYLKAPKVKAHWEIRIISFDQNIPLLDMFRGMFPDVPSRIQRAVNVREMSIYKLYESNLISMSSYLSMTEGRKYHREVNSLGAVGLAQANRIALLMHLKSPSFYQNRKK